MLLAMMCRVAAALEIEVRDILLYAPFDGSTDARFAAGERKAVTRGAPRFEAGKIGRALVVGSRKDSVGFQLRRNIDFEKGSIAFWVAPLDWGHTTRVNHSFIHAKGEEELHLYYFFSGKAVFARLGFEDGYDVMKDASCEEWQKGQWRHIVLNWDKKGLKLYANSYLKAARSISLPEDIGRVLYFGKYPEPSRDAFTYRNDTLIDEFYIFKRPLEIVEIRLLMRRGEKAKESKKEEK
jgi:hypothetical protein